MTPPLAHPALARSLSRRLGPALQAGFDNASDPGPALVQPAAAQPSAPALLTHGQPSPQARQEARALYRRCLAHFRQRVQANDENDDAGLAAAYFVLANLAALHGLRPDAGDLRRVERQLRPQLAAAWLALPLAERQSAFEQLALVGVLVVESNAAARAQGAAAQARVRQAARAYLVQFLGLDPDRLRLGPAGLALALAAA